MSFNHAEAFCLMRYASKNRGARETIWNSRDGVTPYIITSVGGVEMSHVDWNQAARSPEYVPAVGSRVFIDATIEDFVESKAALVRAWWDKPDFAFIREKYSDDFGRTVRALAQEDFDRNPGQPHLAVVTPEMRAMFEQRHG